MRHRYHLQALPPHQAPLLRHHFVQKSILPDRVRLEVGPFFVLSVQLVLTLLYSSQQRVNKRINFTVMKLVD